MRNYYVVVRALRAKAADPAVGEAERKILEAKANEIEAKHCKPSSPFTNDTTVIGRDGHWWPGDPAYEAWYAARQAARKAQAERIAEELRKNQWRWNSEYYDMHGNPRPTSADTDEDYVEETYAWEDYEDHDFMDEDEDAYYDQLFEGNPPL